MQLANCLFRMQAQQSPVLKTISWTVSVSNVYTNHHFWFQWHIAGSNSNLDAELMDLFEYILVEKTLNHYYKSSDTSIKAQNEQTPSGAAKASNSNNLDQGGDSSPERTGTTK